uniref:Single-stranded DNA-binding protein n=1 Tax=Staphylothermus marinus TaxID=2280 RepID=A0A7C4D945_STAMA
MVGSRILIKELKPNQENISIIARVIQTTPSRTINTRKGVRTISNAIIGDESGRVEAVLWGVKAGSLNVNDVVEINGAWTTSFRGKVQLNIGKTSTIKKVDDNLVPPVDSIPETEPESFRKESSQRREFRSRGRMR